MVGHSDPTSVNDRWLVRLGAVIGAVLALSALAGCIAFKALLP